MIIREVLGLLSVAIASISYFIYFVSIFKGKTKPHVFSWFVWGILASIAFFAQLSDKGGAGTWVTGFSAFICFIISGLALFKGEKNITKSDWICFVAALISIPLWYFTKTPIYSVILVVIIEIIGFIPTLRKSYSKPHEEAASCYGLAAIKHVTSILALENLSITTFLYPLSLVIINTWFVLMLLQRRKFYKQI